MHHLPRRNSEFREYAAEEPGTTDKRQTRSKWTLTTPTPNLTTAKMNKRPSHSRLPQPMNLERDRASQMGITPMRNTRGPRPASVERPIALHSDKSWVSERAQQILEYLSNTQGGLQCLGADFFARPGGLRKMTFKQFLGILNFFFQNVWRNKVTVGANPVEDITAALQKLHYPHQVSKSWLSTPATQHSFGHVIVLLDFLMDFAPPLDTMGSEPFPFMETAEQPSSYLHSIAEMTAMSTTHALHAIQLDEELNALLFEKSAECNHFWNEERAEEELQLQARVCDMVISRKSDFSSRQAIDSEIGNLNSQISKLDEQLHNSGEEKKLQQLQKLNQDREQLYQKLRACQEEITQQEDAKIALQSKGKELQEEIQRLTRGEKHLRNSIANQKYTIQQVKALQMQQADLSNESQVYERQVKDLCTRESNQQVMLSRAKKKLLDTIESFNSHVRHFSDSVAAQLVRNQKWDLLLPLQPQSKDDILVRARVLEEFSGIVQQQRQLKEKNRQALEKEINKIQLKCGSCKQEITNLVSRLRVLKQALQNLEGTYNTRREMRRQHQEQLDEEQFRLLDSLEKMQLSEQQLIVKLEVKKQRNEELLTAAEAYQDQLLTERHAYLDDYEKKLAAAQEELDEFNATIEQTDIMLEAKMQLLESTKPASFQPVLEALQGLM
ncbi:kinetochore protein NDC80 homolog isoform X1 [Drosophila bipectinata]|uniref:kinetochore protein NDC80 homolog isoform X1 n=1 Tax=Drosophila bipectinata TaxID=42026 RepID=UPI001C89FD20|nr:GRIP1-associated protein 1 [Drosophila bipectinata]